MALSIAAYIIIILIVFGRALVPGANEMIWGDDIHRQYYFYRQFFNNFLKEGIWPWWNPYIFSGGPFIANAVVNIWYPPTWLFFFLPLNIAYSLHIALHILWAMIGMRVLTRSWVAGLVFGLSGFFSARIWAGHVDVIAAASWMPWVVWAFSKRSTALAAIVFALQLLAGYQTMAFLTAIAVALIAPNRLRSIAAGLHGLGLAAIQIVPLQEFFRQSIRTFEILYNWNSYGSLTLQSLKQFFDPFVFGDQFTYRGPPPNFAEHAFFVSRAGLLLVLLRSPRAFMFLILALFGIWVSLGPNAPVDLQYLLWKTIPAYRYLRLPPRHLILVVFGLSALVGLSLQKIRKPLAFLITIAISFEMIWYARHFIALQPIPETRHDAQLISILKKDSQPYRVLTNFGAWIPPRDSFDFDAGMNYRVFNATGYDPSISRSYYEYIDTANGNKPGASILDHDVQIPYLNVFSPAADFLNIKYILVPRAYDPLHGVKIDRFVLLRQDVGRDYRLYENKTVKPRFYFENGTATVTRYTPNEIVLETNTDGNETLFSSEGYYPGWEGFVDGQNVTVTKNNAFRALSVPAGRHRVVYRYNPRIFWIGGAISGVSVVLCFLLWKKSAVQ